MDRSLIRIGLERESYNYRYDFFLKNRTKKDQFQQISDEWREYRTERGPFVSFKFKNQELFYDFAEEARKLQQHGFHIKKIHVKSFLIDHDLIKTIRNCVKNSRNESVLLDDNLWSDNSYVRFSGIRHANSRFVFYDSLVIVGTTHVTFRLGSFLFQKSDESENERKKYVDFLIMASRNRWLLSKFVTIRIGMRDTYYQEIFEMLKNDRKGHMQKLLKIRI